MAEKAALGTLFLVLSAAILWPLFNLLLGALHASPPGRGRTRYTIDTVVNVFSDPATFSGIQNSLLLAVCVTLIALTLGGGLAWIIARTDVPMRRILQYLVVFPLFLSPFAGAMAWMQLASVKTGLINILYRVVSGDEQGVIINIFTFGGLVWCMSLYFAPYAFLQTVSALSAMDQSMEEASRTAGAGIFTTTRRITLPILLPALVGSAIIIFVLAAEMFSIPGLLGGPSRINTVPYQIFKLTTYYPSQWHKAAALGLFLLAMMAAGLYFYRRIIRQSAKFVTISGRGTKLGVFRLGRLRWAAFCLCISYFALAVVLPYLVIIGGSFVRYFTPELFTGGGGDASTLTLEYWRAAFIDRHFRTALGNSVFLGLASATVATILGIVVSYVVVKTKTRLRGSIDFVTTLPLAVPGIVFGIGMLWAYISSPIYNTLWILMLAYVIRYLPNSARILNSNLLQVNNELQEAALMVGASPSRAVYNIVLPIIRPAIMASWVLLFINVVRELSVTILLYGSRSMVLPVLMWDQMENGVVGQANVTALVLSLLILVVFVLATKIFRIDLLRGT
ncbi:MAG: iron ABC transporter permease [Alphaproteobacteria bacterium]